MRGLVTSPPDFVFLHLHHLHYYVYRCCFAPVQGRHSTTFRVVMKVPNARTISQLSRTQYTGLNTQKHQLYIIIIIIIIIIITAIEFSLSGSSPYTSNK